MNSSFTFAIEMGLRSVRSVPAMALIIATLGASIASSQGPGASGVDFSEVRSVFRKRCLTCHNPEEARGDLDLTSIETIELGGGSGPVVVPGKPEESLIYTATAHLEDPVMPPNSPRIPGRELDLIKRWIESMSRGTEIVTTESTAVTTDAATIHQSPVKGASLNTSVNDEQGDIQWEPIRGLLSISTISALAVHPNKPIFATSGRGQIVIGNYETGQWIGAVSFPEGEVTALRYSRDGEILLAGGGIAGLSGTVLGIDSRTGNTKFRVGDELDSILAVDMTQNGRLLATGGPNKVVRIYSLDSGQILHTLRKHTDWVVSLEFSPDGVLLASSDRFGGVFVWNPSSGELFHGLQGHQGMVSDLTWDTDSENLITGCEDQKLRIWNMHHGEMTVAWDARVGPILGLDHQSNNRIAVGGRNGKSAIWSGPGIVEKTFSGEDQVVRCAFGISGKVVLTGDSSGVIRVFDVESEAELRRVRLPIEAGESEQLFAALAKPEPMDSGAALDRENQKTEKMGAIPVDLQNSRSFAESKIANASDAPGDSQPSIEIGALLRSMTDSLTAHQKLVADLERMRREMEANLKTISDAETVARQILKDQERHVGDLRRLADETNPAMERDARIESLQRRLQTELSLLEKGTELLSVLAEDSVFETSKEVDVLRTFREAIQGRIESTTREIREIDSPGNLKSL